jgi:hypothetical protein
VAALGINFFEKLTLMCSRISVFEVNTKDV